MLDTINEKVSVITINDRERKRVRIHKVRWQGRDYLITKLGLYWKEKEGSARIHVFAVATAAIAFKLRHNAETLEWVLAEVSDGLAA